MVHVSQRIRLENLKTVKKLIAQSMEGGGASHTKLVAVLCTTYGFHRKTANSYLEDLRDSEQVVYDGKVWKLPTEEKKN